MFLNVKVKDLGPFCFSSLARSSNGGKLSELKRKGSEDPGERVVRRHCCCKMPAATDDSYFIEIEDSAALEEKLCEKGIKGRLLSPSFMPHLPTTSPVGENS